MKCVKYLAFMLAILASVCFLAACSDDDDDKTPNGLSAQLIGSWKQTFDDEYVIFTFEKDGTGTFIQKYSDGKEVEHFTWSVSDHLLVLNFGGEYEMFQIISVNSICLVMKFYDKDDDDREEERYYKQ